MSNYFEYEYKQLVKDILKNGEDRDTRNGVTKAVFGRSLFVDLREDKDFIPLVNARRLFPKEVSNSGSYSFIRFSISFKSSSKFRVSVKSSWTVSIIIL